MVDVLIQIDQVYTEIERKLGIRLNHTQIQQGSYLISGATQSGTGRKLDWNVQSHLCHFLIVVFTLCQKFVRVIIEF